MNESNDALDMPLPTVGPSTPDTEPARRRRTHLEVTAEALKAVPNLAKLCVRLLGDSRVPRRAKWLLGLSGLYVVSPVDLIPELLFPIVGRVDDVIVLAFALHRLLGSVEPSVLEEHWDGDGEALELVTALIAWGGELMPSPLRRFLD